MKKLFIYIIAVIISLSCFSPAKATDEKIAAVVNDSVITTSDIKNRIDLYASSSNNPISDKQKNIIKKQVLNKLINESIQIQEAQKLGIFVNKEQISRGLDKLAKQNNTTPENLKKELKDKGVKINTLYNQIQAEISWSSVVRNKLSSKIDISETDIDAAIETIKKEANKTQYLLAEIILKISGISEDKKIKEKSYELLNKLKNGADFAQIAKNFSQSPGASNGGDLGWVEAKTLPKELQKLLKKMKPGDVSSPIRSGNNYYLIFLRNISKKKDPKSFKNDEATRKKIANQIGNKRLMKMSNRYMNDLRSTAFIEKRI